MPTQATQIDDALPAAADRAPPRRPWCLPTALAEAYHHGSMPVGPSRARGDERPEYADAYGLVSSCSSGSKVKPNGTVRFSTRPGAPPANIRRRRCGPALSRLVRRAMRHWPWLGDPRLPTRFRIGVLAIPAAIPHPLS